MSLPVCPSCRSNAITSGYPLDAGHNRCQCGYTAPVAEFHKPFDPATMRQPIVGEIMEFIAPASPRDMLPPGAKAIRKRVFKQAKTPSGNAHYYWQDF